MENEKNEEIMKVWIAGRYIDGEPPKVAWGFIGVFSTRAKAISACMDVNCFIAPFIMDEPANKEETIIRDVEYPLVEKAEDENEKKD